MTNPVFKPTFRHVLDDDVIEACTDRRPSMIRDRRVAKELLQEVGGDSATSVYDHLSSVIKRILEDRPPNVIDYFEDFSRQIREEHFKANDITLQETFIEPERLMAAQSILPLLKVGLLYVCPNKKKRFKFHFHMPITCVDSTSIGFSKGEAERRRSRWRW